MSGPSVYLSWPTSFKLIPDPLPQALPPPIKERTLRAPFGINKELYNFVLRPEVPLIVASSYIVSVLCFNAYNRSRNHQPWWISRQLFFRYFVVLHNILLALFSFATLAAMTRAIIHTWPGYVPEHPAASIADALCKLHGPRGIGDAAAFNTTINIWEAKNALIKIGFDGNPDATDVGRLWNEGLAFWGWVFYVSKFYEIIDTSIILAKGKRSATLQTYHHAGAMLCMWAGIRYMSPPIWMFVFVNSGIHAIMYTYFTLSALGYRVPQSLKRTLTSLQIAQFVWGASYAALHLFVQYDIPISTPYQVVSAVEQAVSSASSAVSSFVVETPTASSDWINLVKKLLLRAAGEEGPAERIGLDSTSAVISAAPKITEHVPKIEKVVKRIFETRYRTDWTKVNCIDTTGEAFAIYLNLLYLAPLTWLFARFFIKAYLQRAKPRTVSEATRDAKLAGKQAQAETRGRVEKAGLKAEEDLVKREIQAEDRGKDLREELRKDVQAMREGTFGSTTIQRVSDQASNAANKVEEVVGNLAEQTKEGVETLVDQTKEGFRKIMNGSEGSNVSNFVSSSTSGTNDSGSTQPFPAFRDESAIDNQGGDSGYSRTYSYSTNDPGTTTYSQTYSSSTNESGSSSSYPQTQVFTSSGYDPSFTDDEIAAAAAAAEAKRPLAMPERRTPPQTKVPQRSPGGMGLFRSPGVDDYEESSSTEDVRVSSSNSGTSAETSSVSRTIEDPFFVANRADDGKTSAPLPKRMQDTVLETSQNVRPDPEEDTDAMGRSGVNVKGSGSASS